MTIEPERMNKILNNLAKWRSERRLSETNQFNNLKSNISEEIKEYREAKDDNERIDALCDILVFIINAMPKDINAELWGDLIDCIEDRMSYPEFLSFTAREILYEIITMGYNPYDCMDETIKEISSRTGKWNESKGKWIKDTSDEAKANWYKANYDRCKE